MQLALNALFVSIEQGERLMYKTVDDKLLQFIVFNLLSTLHSTLGFQYTISFLEESYLLS